VVEVYDSAFYPNPPDDKVAKKPSTVPGKEGEPLAINWFQSHPCPPCVGLELRELDDQRRTLVQDCLRHVAKTLSGMLDEASDYIKKKAVDWEK